MKEETTKFAVIDASYILAYLMPDEKGEDVSEIFNKYRNVDLNFIAPYILPFEVTNAVKSACVSQRITPSHAVQIIDDFNKITVDYVAVDFSAVYTVAVEKNISAYDASYVVLAEKLNTRLLTLDRKLRTTTG